MFEDLKPHIADLRKRLIISVSVLILMFFICFSFNEYILSFILQPLIDALPKETKPVFLQVGEAFVTAIRVSFFSAFIFSIPIIFWQIWLFIAPGLYANEKKMILPFVFFSSLMFICGALFAYYVVFPYALHYLINFGNSQNISAMPSIGYYTGFFAKMMIGFGVAFELPVISFFLAKLGLITDKTLIKFFRIAIVLIFILSAFLTPPDISTQFLMAIPLIILYGVSIIIVYFVNREEKEKIDNE